jgi:hypothetical protein
MKRRGREEKRPSLARGIISMEVDDDNSGLFD